MDSRPIVLVQRSPRAKDAGWSDGNVYVRCSDYNADPRVQGFSFFFGMPPAHRRDLLVYLTREEFLLLMAVFMPYLEPESSVIFDLLAFSRHLFTGS